MHLCGRSATPGLPPGTDGQVGSPSTIPAVLKPNLRQLTHFRATRVVSSSADTLLLLPSLAATIPVPAICLPPGILPYGSSAPLLALSEILQLSRGSAAASGASAARVRSSWLSPGHPPGQALISLAHAHAAAPAISTSAQHAGESGREEDGHQGPRPAPDVMAQVG